MHQHKYAEAIVIRDIIVGELRIRSRYDRVVIFMAAIRIDLGELQQCLNRVGAGRGAEPHQCKRSAQTRGRRRLEGVAGW